MANETVPREQGILAKLFREQQFGPQYQQLPTQDRLGLLQGAIKAGQEPSEQDIEILRRLRALRTEEGAAIPTPQLTPQDEGPGFLGSLWQFFTGRQVVDPLGPLKEPGYSGPASR